MKSKPRRLPGAANVWRVRQGGGAKVPLDNEVARIAAARVKVERALGMAAPGFALGEGPLNRLAWWLKDAPFRGWVSMETGFQDKRDRLKRIASAAEMLLAEIARPSVNDSPALAHLARELLQPLRVMHNIAASEGENIPPPEPRAWKALARIFYELTVQCWIEGGADFFRGSVPRFGVGEHGKATKAVKNLLHVAGKDVTESVMAKTLATCLVPGPWIPEGETEKGKDFDAWCAGIWDYDQNNCRIILSQTESVSKYQAAGKKKKRGRPRKI